MRKVILSALALLAFAGAAKAGTSAEYACMRDGPMSQACELAAIERQQDNERRQQQQQGAYPRRCLPGYRCN
jgi:hypothetical protein